MKKPSVRYCYLTKCLPFGSSYPNPPTQVTYHIINGHEVVCLWEPNKFYGDLLRQWIIDGTNISKRAFMYEGMDMDMIFDCSNGLIAEPPYPEGSSILGDFLEPLGIDSELFRHKGSLMVKQYEFCKHFPKLPTDHPLVEATAELGKQAVEYSNWEDRRNKRLETA